MLDDLVGGSKKAFFKAGLIEVISLDLVSMCRSWNTLHFSLAYMASLRRKILGRETYLLSRREVR